VMPAERISGVLFPKGYRRNAELSRRADFRKRGTCAPETEKVQAWRSSADDVHREHIKASFVRCRNQHHGLWNHIKNVKAIKLINAHEKIVGLRVGKILH